MDESEEVALLPSTLPPTFPSLDERVAALGLRFATSLAELKRERGRKRRFAVLHSLRRQNALQRLATKQPDRVKLTDTQGVVLRWMAWETGKCVRALRTCMFLCLFYSSLTSLYFLGFSRPSSGLLQVDRIVQVVFAGECIAMFFITRKDKEGYILISRKLVAKGYLRSWLIFDLVALFPFREIGYEDVNYLVRLPRLLRLLLAVRSLRSNLVDFAIATFKSSRLAPRILQISYYVHTAAGIVETLFHLSLLTYTLSSLFLWLSDLSKDWEKQTFWSVYRLREENTAQEVLQTMYFIFSTLATVGYGDFVPQNTFEQSFMIFVLFIGVLTFSVFVGQLHAGIVEYQTLFGRQEHTDSLERWISTLEHRFGHLPNALRRKVLAHYSFYSRYDRLKSLAKSYWHYRSYAEMVRQDGVYVEHLPEEMLRAVLDDLFSDVFYRFRSFFAGGEVKYALALHFQPRAYQVGEALIEESALVPELLFVLQGSVLCGVKVCNHLHSIIVYERGWTLLGDYEVLTGDQSIAIYQCTGAQAAFAFAIPAKAVNMVLDGGFTDARFRVMQRALARRSELKRRIAEFTNSREMMNMQVFVAGLLIHALQDAKEYSGFVASLQRRFVCNQHIDTPELASVKRSESELYCQVDDALTDSKSVVSTQFKDMMFDCSSAATLVRLCSDSLEKTRKKMNKGLGALRAPLRKVGQELSVTLLER